MKKLTFLLLMIACTSGAFSQSKYMTKDGFIKFYSHTAIEDITAENREVGSIIDSENGEIVITLFMTKFDFEKKLMQEHFNENYVESEKYPKATFKGFITNNKDVDYSKKGIYNVKVSGDMTIHGVTQKVSTEGTVEVTEAGLTAKTSFLLNPEDYKIKIPKIVREKIANNMEITADLGYKRME